MRVVAGRYRGRLLKAPKGLKTRPTADKVREAIFDLLGPVEGFGVADLFAGSGALGIEALSRGAVRLMAVDRGAEAVTAIRTNLDRLGLEEGGEPEVTILRRDLSRGLGFLTRWPPFDLILADPPYGRGWPLRLTKGLPDGALAGGGRLVIESDPVEPPFSPGRWELIKQRRYGQTVVSVLALKDKSNPAGPEADGMEDE